MAYEQDAIRTDASWPSNPQFLADFVPPMMNDENLGLWANQWPLYQLSSPEVEITNEMPQPLFQQQYSVLDAGISILDNQDALRRGDAHVDSALDRMNLDMDPCVIDLDSDLHRSVGRDIIPPAPEAPRCPDIPSETTRLTRINPRQTEILTVWLAENPEPYPSKDEKMTLSLSTGLSVKQISGWFTRTRQRVLKRAQPNARLSSEIELAALSTTHADITSNKKGPNSHVSESPAGSKEGPDHTLDQQWLRCTSQPPQSGRPYARISPKRAQSLPHVFTLDTIKLYTPDTRQSPQKLSSLHVDAPTHKSGGFKYNEGDNRAEIPSSQAIQYLTNHPPKDVPKSSFIEAWIQDVAQQRISTTDDSYLVRNDANIARMHKYLGNASEVLGHDKLEDHGEYIQTTIQHSETIYDDQSVLMADDSVVRPRKRRLINSCASCRMRKALCSGYDPEAPCSNCSKLNLKCELFALPTTPVTTMPPPNHSTVSSSSPPDFANGFHKTDREHEATSQHLKDDVRPDSMSSAGSSAGSAASYMSFGPRRGRRMAFGEGIYHTLRRPSLATPHRRLSQSPPYRIRKPHSPFPDDEGQRTLGLWSTYNCAHCDEPICEMTKKDHKCTNHKKLFGCTFCGKEFAKFWPWRRHEESTHAPQYTWICRPDIFNTKFTTSSCLVCTSSSSDMASTSEFPCPHRFQECWQKPEIDRTFYRYDTFMQHLRSVHFKKPDDIHDRKIRDRINISKCKEPIATAYDLVCHFCGFNCKDWVERTQHIGNHFRDGVPIKLWIPGGPHILAFYTHRSLAGTAPHGWACELHRETASGIFGRYGLGWDRCYVCGAVLEEDKAWDHMEETHLVQQCSASDGHFSYAKDYVRHLVSEHRGVVGYWMSWLII